MDIDLETRSARSARAARSGRTRRGSLLLAGAVAVLLAACQTPLGQAGFDSANTSSNPAETTLSATNVGGVVAKLDVDLSAFGSVHGAAEPVFSSNGSILVATDSEVVSVNLDGTVAWHTAIADAHPEIDAPHITALYGNSSTVDVAVDLKVQGAAPGYVGGSVVKLDLATGAVVSSQATFRPAAPMGYSNGGAILTGQVVDHATYGTGRTITIDVAGSGRRIVRNTVGTVAKPAVSGDRVAIAIGDTVYQWSAPCTVGTVCDETAAATTSVPGATRPLIVGSMVYVAGSNRLHALGADGVALWTGSFSGNPPAPASASTASGRVFVGGAVGILYGFPLAGCGASTCSYVMVQGLIDQIWTAPTLANGLAYQMVNGSLRIVRTDCTLTENCAPKRSITLNGPIGGSLHQVLVKDGRFYVLTQDAHLRAWGL